jgi:hypothetical protein
MKFPNVYKRFVELTNPKNKAELVLFMNDHFYQKYTSYEFKNADIISNGNNTKINIYKDDYYLSLRSKSHSIRYHQILKMEHFYTDGFIG